MVLLSFRLSLIFRGSLEDVGVEGVVLGGITWVLRIFRGEILFRERMYTCTFIRLTNKRLYPKHDIGFVIDSLREFTSSLTIVN